MPGTTCTSSQPSSPQLSRICLVAWTSTGTVTYSHFVMAATVATGSGVDALRTVHGRRLGPGGGDQGVAELDRLGRAGGQAVGSHRVREPWRDQERPAADHDLDGGAPGLVPDRLEEPADGRDVTGHRRGDREDVGTLLEQHRDEVGGR